MNRRALILPLVVLVFSTGLLTKGALDQRSAQAEPSFAAPTIAAPAPPSNAPSRKQTGGPDDRLAWDIQRLADPATGTLPDDIHRREQMFAANLPSWQRSAALDGQRNAGAADKLLGWQYRGPWNIGGRTRALAFDVSDPTFATLLAGGVSGGMWRTTNDGDSWALTTGSSQLHAVSTVAQDVRPGRENVWYYGTGEIRGNSAGAGGATYRGDGVFKSTDNGVTWSLLPSTSGGDVTVFSGAWQYVHRLAVDHSELVNDEIYAAVYGFIERSTDGGATWTRVLGDEVAQSRYTDVVVSSAGVVYASLSRGGGTHGVFRSTDGLSWTDITPAGLTGYNRIVLALAPSDESILYFLVSDLNSSTDEGFFKYQYLSGDGSGTGGASWNRSAQMLNLPGPGEDESMECYSSYCQNVTVNPVDPDQVYIGGIHLLRSTDGFATNNADRWIGGWQYADHHADQHWLMFQPGSAEIAYSGSDGGVHRTDNISAPSVAWRSLSNGYNTSQFYAVAIDENLPGSDVLIGGMQDNGTWFTSNTNATEPWVEALGGDGSYCAVVDASGVAGTYLVSVQNGVVYRVGLDNTTGALSSWTRVDPVGGGAYLFINPLIVNPNDTRQLYVGSDNGVWRNSDVTAIPLWSDNPTSQNWVQLTTVPGLSVTALAMTQGANPSLYYGVAGGDMYRLDNADTTPAGSVPTPLNMGADWPFGGYVAAITTHPTDNNKLLVAVSNYNVSSLFYSDDAGTSWSAVEGNLAGASGPSARTVAILPVDGTDIFLVGTSTGLYSTFTLAGAGTVWSQESPDLMGNVVVDHLATRATDGVVVAGTHGKGVYSLSLQGLSSVGDELPRSVGALAQNVPNPFNPMTRIAFELPSAGQTRLVVYDVAGREVRTLVDGKLAAGEHTFNWNGADDAGRQVSAGVYLYHLRSGVVDEVRRMTLVR